MSWHMRIIRLFFHTLDHENRNNNKILKDKNIVNVEFLFISHFQSNSGGKRAVKNNFGYN